QARSTRRPFRAPASSPALPRLGRRKKRRLLAPLLLPLDLDLAHEEARTRRGNGHPARLRAAHPIERLVVVRRGHDVGEGREGRPNDVGPAHQLLSPVGADAVDDDRQNLERLREGALCEREASLQVVEEQAVRLPLALDLFDQHLLQPGVRDRARGLHDEVPLPRDHGVARMAPAVAVGLVEAARWLSCHEEPLHHTVLHERRALRAHSLVVEGVRAGEYRPVERPECRVVIDRDEGGHYLLADLLREGLTLLFLALAVPLYAVAEDLVEDDARRLPLVV